MVQFRWEYAETQCDPWATKKSNMAASAAVDNAMMCKPAQKPSASAHQQQAEADGKARAGQHQQERLQMNIKNVELTLASSIQHDCTNGPLAFDVACQCRLLADKSAGTGSRPFERCPSPVLVTSHSSTAAAADHVLPSYPLTRETR